MMIKSDNYEYKGVLLSVPYVLVFFIEALYKGIIGSKRYNDKLSFVVSNNLST